MSHSTRNIPGTWLDHPRYLGKVNASILKRRDWRNRSYKKYNRVYRSIGPLLFLKFRSVLKWWNSFSEYAPTEYFIQSISWELVFVKYKISWNRLWNSRVSWIFVRNMWPTTYFRPLRIYLRPVTLQNDSASLDPLLWSRWRLTIFAYRKVYHRRCFERPCQKSCNVTGTFLSRVVGAQNAPMLRCSDVLSCTPSLTCPVPIWSMWNCACATCFTNSAGERLAVLQSEYMTSVAHVVQWELSALFRSILPFFSDKPVFSKYSWWSALL